MSGNHAKFFENVIDNIIKPIGEELEGKIDSAPQDKKRAIIADIEKSHYQIDYAAQLTTTDTVDDTNIYIQDANINITKKIDAEVSNLKSYNSLSELINSFSNIKITDEGIKSFQQKIKGGGKSLNIKFSIVFNFKVEGNKVLVENFYKKDNIFEVGDLNDENINTDKKYIDNGKKIGFNNNIQFNFNDNIDEQMKNKINEAFYVDDPNITEESLESESYEDLFETPFDDFAKKENTKTIFDKLYQEGTLGGKIVGGGASEAIFGKEAIITKKKEIYEKTPFNESSIEMLFFYILGYTLIRVEKMMRVYNTDILIKIITLLSNDDTYVEYCDYMFIKVDQYKIVNAFHKSENGKEPKEINYIRALDNNTIKYISITSRPISSSKYAFCPVFVKMFYDDFFETIYDATDSKPADIFNRDNKEYLRTILKYLLIIEKKTLSLLEKINGIQKTKLDNEFQSFIKSKKRVITIAKRRHDNSNYDANHPYFVTKENIYKQGMDDLKYLDVYYNNTYHQHKLFSYCDIFGRYKLTTGYNESLNAFRNTNGYNGTYDGVDYYYEPGSEPITESVSGRKRLQINTQLLKRVGGGLKKLKIDTFNELHKFGPFDHLFNEPGSNNEIVTKEILKGFREKFISNKPIIMIGLGQSGSGKTSTLIQLKTKDKTEDGILIELLKNIEGLTSVKLKCVNLYFKDETNKLGDISKFEMANYKYEKYSIKNDNYKSEEILVESNSSVDTLKTFTKDNIGDIGGEILKLFEKRQIYPTPNNEVSSRSHMVLCLDVHVGEETSNKIIVCDLAGVENKFQCDQEVELLKFERQYKLLTEGNDIFGECKKSIDEYITKYGKQDVLKSNKPYYAMSDFLNKNDKGIDIGYFQTFFVELRNIYNYLLIIKMFTKYEGEEEGENELRQWEEGNVLIEKIDETLTDDLNKLHIKTHLNSLHQILTNLVTSIESRVICNHINFVNYFKNGVYDFKNPGETEDIDLNIEMHTLIFNDSKKNMTPEEKKIFGNDPVLFGKATGGGNKIQFYGNHENNYPLNKNIVSIVSYFRSRVTDKNYKFNNILDTIFSNTYFSNNIDKLWHFIMNKYDIHLRFTNTLEIYGKIKNQLQHKFYGSEGNVDLSYDSSIDFILYEIWNEFQKKEILDKLKKKISDFIKTYKETIITLADNFGETGYCIQKRMKKIKEQCATRVKEGYMINRSLADLSKGITRIVNESFAEEYPLYLERQIAPKCRNNYLKYYQFNNESLDSSEEINSGEKYGAIFHIIKNCFGIELKDVFIYSLLVYNTSFFSEQKIKIEKPQHSDVVDQIKDMYDQGGKYVAYDKEYSDENGTNIGTTNNPPNPPYVNLTILKHFCRYNNDIDKLKSVVNTFLTFIKNYSFYGSIKFPVIQEEKQHFKTYAANVEKIIQIVETNNAGTLLGTLETIDNMQSITLKDVHCNNIASVGDYKQENYKSMIDSYNKDLQESIKEIKDAFVDSHKELVESLLETRKFEGNEKTTGGRRTRKKYRKKRKTRNKKRKVNMSKVINKKVIKTKRI